MELLIVAELGAFYQHYLQHRQLDTRTEAQYLLKVEQVLLAKLEPH
jgi:hypothetical protein